MSIKKDEKCKMKQPHTYNRECSYKLGRQEASFDIFLKRKCIIVSDDVILCPISIIHLAPLERVHFTFTEPGWKVRKYAGFDGKAIAVTLEKMSIIWKVVWNFYLYLFFQMHYY